jgi:hypothetical protein
LDINASNIAGIATAEYQVSVGGMFSSSFYTASLAAAGVSNIGITTGAVPVFITLSLDTTSVNSTVGLYEGGTYTAGSVLPALNLNRVSSKASPLAELKSGITVSTAGNLIANRTLLGASGQGQSTSLVAGVTNILLLAPNTKYIIVVTNTSAGAAPYVLSLSFAAYS